MDIASSAMGPPMSFPPDDEEDEEVVAVDVSMRDKALPAEEPRTEGERDFIQSWRPDLGIVLPPAPNVTDNQIVPKKKDKQKKREEKRQKKEERRKGIHAKRLVMNEEACPTPPLTSHREGSQWEGQEGSWCEGQEGGKGLQGEEAQAEESRRGEGGGG